MPLKQNKGYCQKEEDKQGGRMGVKEDSEGKSLVEHSMHGNIGMKPITLMCT